MWFITSTNFQKTLHTHTQTHILQSMFTHSSIYIQRYIYFIIASHESMNWNVLGAKPICPFMNVPLSDSRASQTARKTTRVYCRCEEHLCDAEDGSGEDAKRPMMFFTWSEGERASTPPQHVRLCFMSRVVTGYEPTTWQWNWCRNIWHHATN